MSVPHPLHPAGSAVRNVSFSGDRREAGSILIVAMLLTALVALGLGSYLNLNLSSARLAHRTFHLHAAFNLAEAGAEEALWSFNEAAMNAPEPWKDWTQEGPSAWRNFNGFDFGANTTGSIKVYVDSTVAAAANARPRIVSLSSVEAPGSSPVTKMIEITLARRSPFANGLMAKDRISFSGLNTSVDSWNSDPDNDPETPPIPYSAPVRNDRGTVASASVVNTAVLINQATVWGFVSTGGELPTVGTKGLIGPFGTPEGTIHPGRVSTDFVANFAPVTPPEGGTIITSIGATLGTAGETTLWRCPHFALRGNQTLTILGDVTLVLTAGSGARAIDVTGNAAIIIPDGSSFTVYVEGDVLIAGNGVANANPHPASFQLWGVGENLSLQDIHIAGNGELKAVVYTPNASVKINGNGDVMGSVVAHDITFTGNAAFHYDESLANFGAGQPFGVVRWRSLTSEASRQPYLELLNGLGD